MVMCACSEGEINGNPENAESRRYEEGPVGGNKESVTC